MIPTPALATSGAATPSTGCAPTSTSGWPAHRRDWGAVPGPVVLRLGRRGAAGGHPNQQPDRSEPGGQPNHSAGTGSDPGRGDDRRRVEVLEITALPAERGDRFAARAGFDPRELTTSYRWFRIAPRRIQAWREVNELADRELMRDGRWLV